MIKARNFDEPFVDVGVKCTAEEGRTKQADAVGCDINNILKRYEKTGVLPDMIKQNPAFGDFSDAPEYRVAIDIARRAEAQFAALDASIRARFNNDPAQFLEFTSDSKNIDEMEKMGLLKPEVVKARQQARIDADLAIEAKRKAAKEAGKPVV